MELNKNMCQWELEKAGFLMVEAGKIGMDLTGYGELSMNSSSGNVYLWLEDYTFTLYMPISCELVKTDIIALWTNPEDGVEIELELKKNTSLYDLEEWTKKLDKKYNQ